MLRVCLLLVCLVPVAACGADEPSGAPATSTSDADTTASEPTPTTRTDTTASELTSTTDESPPSTTTSTTSPATSDPDCRLVADLDDPEELARWQIVNDGVMGGRSSAEATVESSVLALAGEIVTDGGGFSSVRLDLAEPLGEVTSLLVRLRTDGRAYELTMADAADGRDRRISFQALLPTEGTGDWEEVTVEFDDLEASVFGRRVEVEPFEPTAAIEVGIILADGADGPFLLELDWFRACP